MIYVVCLLSFFLVFDLLLAHGWLLSNKIKGFVEPFILLRSNWL